MAQIVKEFHLDEPMWRRYLLWLSDALHGDLGQVGRSRARRSRRRSPRPSRCTLQLMLYAQIVGLMHRDPGRASTRPYRANKRRRPCDQHAWRSPSCRSRTSCWPSCSCCSSPSAASACSATRSAGEVLPASRYVDFGQNPVEHFKRMVLPTIALALGLAATYMRMLRSDMISTLQENFITTAKAKGVPDRRILLGHALRPSSFTLLTVFGVQTATLDRRRPHHRADLLAARSRHADRHRHLPEGLPRRPGRRRRHRRRLRADQLPRRPALRRSRPKGAPCPRLMSPMSETIEAGIAGHRGGVEPERRLPQAQAGRSPSGRRSGGWCSS